MWATRNSFTTGTSTAAYGCMITDLESRNGIKLLDCADSCTNYLFVEKKPMDGGCTALMFINMPTLNVIINLFWTVCLRPNNQNGWTGVSIWILKSLTVVIPHYYACLDRGTKENLHALVVWLRITLKEGWKKLVVTSRKTIPVEVCDKYSRIHDSWYYPTFTFGDQL